MTDVLIFLAGASALLALALRAWGWHLNQRYKLAMRDSALLDQAWVAHRDTGFEKFMSGEWDEQSAWEAAGLGEEWQKYSSY